MRTDFAVVGGGLLGLSAAWALTRRGHEALVIDQAPTGHVTGGSHGSCRIFRLGYEQPAYVSLARLARDTWAELEEASGERLLHPTPQLTFGPQMPQVRHALREAGCRHDTLTPAEAAERFPGVAVSGPVLYEPESAVIAADRTLAALARLAGPVSDPTAVTALAERGSGVRVSTASGTIDAGRVIVCAGPWTPALLAGAAIAVPGAASMEQVAYLERRHPYAADANMPIFVHYGGEFPYGLPVPGSARYKVGIHFGGPPTDPDRQDHTENAELTSKIERATRQFLPGFEPKPVATQRCVYDTSPDTDFIIDRVGNIVIGSGTSGHGFKFGPLIGEWLATLATGRADRGGTPPPWLSLGRFTAPATVLLWATKFGLSTASTTARCTGT